MHPIIRILYATGFIAGGVPLTYAGISGIAVVRQTTSIAELCPTSSPLANIRTASSDLACIYEPSFADRFLNSDLILETFADALSGDVIRPPSLVSTKVCNEKSCDVRGKFLDLDGIANPARLPIAPDDRRILIVHAVSDGVVSTFDGYNRARDVVRISQTNREMRVSSYAPMPAAASVSALNEYTLAADGIRKSQSRVCKPNECVTEWPECKPPGLVGAHTKTSERPVIRIAIAVSELALFQHWRDDGTAVVFLKTLDAAKSDLEQFLGDIDTVRFEVALTVAQDLAVQQVPDAERVPIDSASFEYARVLGLFETIPQYTERPSTKFSKPGALEWPVRFPCRADTYCPIRRVGRSDRSISLMFDDVTAANSFVVQDQNACDQKQMSTLCTGVQAVKLDMGADAVVFVSSSTSSWGQAKLNSGFRGAAVNFGLDHRQLNAAFVFDESLSDKLRHEVAHLLGAQHGTDKHPIWYFLPDKSTPEQVPNRPLLIRLESKGGKACSDRKASCATRWVGTVESTTADVDGHLQHIKSLSNPGVLCGAWRLGDRQKLQDSLSVAKEVSLRYASGERSPLYYVRPADRQSAVLRSCYPLNGGVADFTAPEAIKLYQTASALVSEGPPAAKRADLDRAADRLALLRTALRDKSKLVLLASFADSDGLPADNYALALKRHADTLSALCGTDPECRSRIVSCAYGSELEPFARASPEFRRASYARILQ